MVQVHVGMTSENGPQHMLYDPSKERGITTEESAGQQPGKQRVNMLLTNKARHLHVRHRDSAVGDTIPGARTHTGTHGGTDTRARARRNSVVGAEHANAGAKLGSAERDHMLANMGSYNLTVLRVGMSQDVLDEIIAVLVAGDINQRNARAVDSTLAHTIEVSAEKLRATNLQTLLDNLGGKLVHAVFSRVPNHMVDGAAAVSRGAMLADVLDAPVSKLAMRNNVDVGQDFLDTGTLSC